MAEYVRQIQAKRREALNTTIETVRDEDEKICWNFCTYGDLIVYMRTLDGGLMNQIELDAIYADAGYSSPGKIRYLLRYYSEDYMLLSSMVLFLC